MVNDTIAAASNSTSTAVPSPEAVPTATPLVPTTAATTATTANLFATEMPLPLLSATTTGLDSRQVRHRDMLREKSSRLRIMAARSNANVANVLANVAELEAHLKLLQDQYCAAAAARRTLIASVRARAAAAAAAVPVANEGASAEASGPTV